MTSTTAIGLDATVPAVSSKPVTERLLLRWLRAPKIVVGFAIVLFFVLVAVLGPMIYTKSPSAITPDMLQGPSAAHPFGTTQNGQDVLAEMINGTGATLLVGFGAGAVATFLSMLIGMVAGFAGGAVDEVLSAFSNIFLVIPGLPLVIVLAAYLHTGSSALVALVIAATGWAWGARVIRAQTLSVRRRDFVLAARATGEPWWRIVFVEILPNEAAIVASSFLFTVIAAVLTYAALSFLGVGDLSTWSWGSILYWAQNGSALLVGAWWWFVPPGAAIALLGAGLALMNFGVDELINPRLRQAGIGTRAALRAERRRIAEVDRARREARRRGQAGRHSEKGRFGQQGLQEGLQGGQDSPGGQDQAAERGSAQGDRDGAAPVTRRGRRG
jgi:ABC-type dipeptide/oligopeptide/nickel transport system permease subunit